MYKTLRQIGLSLVTTLWLSTLAHADDPLAEIQALLQNGQFEEAFPKLKNLADAGHAGSQYMMCSFYDQGLVVKLNHKISHRYCEAAANQGHPMAIGHLGSKYFTGSGVSQDKARGVELFTQAAELNDTGAMVSLSHLHIMGDGVERDTERAYELAMRAAKLGSPSGAFAVGNLYLMGLEPNTSPDSPINVGEAMRWLHSSADMGFIPAFTILGQAYADPQLGIGDYEEAYFWLSLAHQYGVEEIKNLKYEAELKLNKARRNHVTSRLQEWQPKTPTVN